MKKILFFVIVIALIALLIFVLVKQNERPSGGAEKITVVTTLFPLYDFAKQIGGDKADVTLLLPPGVEAHSFEPKPSDVRKINEADVFVYTGKFMEPWVSDVLAGVINNNLTVVDASFGVTLIPAVFHDADEPVGSPDPHIWLDFGNDQTIVDNITRAFVEKDPADKDYFEQRAEKYKTALTNLDSEYQSGLANCKNKEIVYGGHYAFGYLAKRYNLTYLAAMGLAPDSEPTAQDLVNLVNQIRQNNIKYVFYEELTSPRIAETLANETGAKLLLLNAAHNVSKNDIQNNVTFIELMEKNLINLKTGLECE